MYDGKDADLINRIGAELLGALPSQAQSITANGRAGDDWARVSFQYTDADGELRQFSFENNPDDAADEIGEALMELHQLMTTEGREDWNRVSITVNRAEQFEVNFSYEPEDQQV
jgi:hypothetical protein